MDAKEAGEGRPAFRDVGTSHRLSEFSSGQSTQQNRTALSSQGPFLISGKQSHLSSFRVSVASSHLRFAGTAKLLVHLGHG